MSRNHERLCWILAIALLILAACETREETLNRISKGEGKHLMHCVWKGGGSAGAIELDCFDASPEAVK